jgi:large-conductance mechanosensitive channel
VFGEFIQFLRKTNALALAVGVIIGGAIGKVVPSGRKFCTSAV